MRFPDNVFDTVIDTFGLCSYENPEIAINEMVRVCKPGCKILLLEHGLGNWNMIKKWQEKKMLKHVYSWGCYFNRDILSYIQNRQDIEIKTLERRHFGTTYYIEAIKKELSNQTQNLTNIDNVDVNDTLRVADTQLQTQI